MFDNTQIVETKDLAKAINSLLAMSLKPEQLTQIKVTEVNGDINYVAPGMITRILDTTLYNPERKGSWIHYITGENFKLDIPVEDLADQLKLESTGN